MIRHWLGALAILAAVLVVGPPARAETEVDLALVLAVDVSRSMDREEQELQRDGYVEAFRSAVVHDAIEKGMLGRIAVVYFEWSGPGQNQIIVPWTVIDGRGEATGFAERLARAPIGRIYSTSISGAIDYGVDLIRQSGVTALRSVIDISGDGPNNTGRPVTVARDAAVQQGIVINGLPFMLKRPTGFGDIDKLDEYYEDCVIGGPGAFQIPIRERNQIAEATRTKILREIAGAPSDATVQFAQGREPSDCMIGERQRRQQWGP